jgi:ribosomal protein L5
MLLSLMKELGLKNFHDVPRLEKIVVNVGLGRAKDDKKAHGSCHKHTSQNNGTSTY